jgi:hypothetical protein
VRDVPVSDQQAFPFREVYRVSKLQQVKLFVGKAWESVPNFFGENCAVS